jgi:hypothetical protein
MEDGGWKMESGRWRVEDGESRMEHVGEIMSTGVEVPKGQEPDAVSGAGSRETGPGPQEKKLDNSVGSSIFVEALPRKLAHSPL